MKKVGLVMTMLIISVSIFAQKHVEKKTNYFVDAAVEEFSLNEEQKTALYNLYFAQTKEVSLFNKEVKAGTKTKEQRTAFYKANTQKLYDMLIAYTGKKKKELKPFMDRVRNELKNIK